MNNYTITLHDLLKSGFDIGLKEYSIFDESYREILNNAIIKFYEFREIGFVNPSMFKDRLNARMDLIMRNKYNDLYNIKKTQFNPLYNIELHDTYTRTIDSNTEDKSTQEANGSVENNTSGYVSRYPTEAITNGDLTSPLYANNGNVNKGRETTSDKNTINGESKGKTIETYEHTQEGSSAGLPFSKALLQFKQYISQFRLDEQVIGELSDLFMNCW